MRKPITTILAGFLALFAFTPSADAAPADGKRAAVRSVCETGYRGMPEYDRKCLKRGTVMDGVNLWFRYIDTNKMVPVKERKFLCREATAMGMGTRQEIIDILNDVAYDHYTNYGTMLNIAGTVAVMDCKMLGIKIKK
jgi:hypothetical protein